MKWWWCWASGLIDSLRYRVPVDGHLYDEPTFRIRGRREYEYRTCLWCGTSVEQGWRRMPT